MGFRRHIEDFDCVVCGHHNVGDGYTNHCARCLHSRHVDESPGDRAHGCRGVMRPVGVDQKAGEFVIVHECVECGARRRCRTSPADDVDTLREIAAHPDPSS
jgi:transcription elongation factor Elf1